MKKIIPTLALFIILSHPSFTQINNAVDSIINSQIDWDNYSTSINNPNPSLGNIFPMLLTAIPYNGFRSNFDESNAPMDMSFGGSAFRFQSNLNNNTRRINTYDSSDAYFLGVGIYAENADKYEYSVVLNGKDSITVWSKITKFTNFQLNDFKKGFAFLGGYKTTWGNYIQVLLREKKSQKIITSTIVFWKQIKPQISSVFLSKDLNDFLKLLKSPWDKSIKYNEIPKNPIFEPTERNIIFYLNTDIYKKEALEYSLLKDGNAIVDWKPNDFDNNFIWLKNLDHGEYLLKMRYAKQRHNVSTYTFKIKAFWYQTLLFKIITTLLAAGSIGFVFLLIRLSQQKKKLLAEKQKKEITESKLKAIRSQLNPHFVFNSLSSIQGLINKNEIDNANKYLSDFASLMRNTLNGNENQNNSLAQEIKLLENYLQLEQLRFHFQYEITVEKNINQSSLEIPSLLLQPLVENAVKHGISNLKENGRINLLFSQIDKNISCTISDNGKGFDKNKITKGFGLRLTKERIALINETLKNQSIQMEIETVQGTSVHLIFENWLS